MQLNRKKPYSEIYGHSIAKYYQDGKYFNGSGELVSVEQASKLYGLTKARIKELEKESLDLDETVESDEPTETVEVLDQSVQERYDQLMKLHHTAITSMAADLYEQMIKDGVAVGDEGIPFTGEGSKEKNARWIAEHTE